MHKPQPTVAKVIALACRLAQEPRSEQAWEWREELTDLVDVCLETGADALLDVALSECKGEAAFFELLDIIGWQTDKLYFEVGKGTITAATLFAIPVMFSDDVPTLQCDLDGSSPDFDNILKACRKHGLVRQEASVAMHPYLYRADELTELPFSKIRKLLEFSLEAIRGMPHSDWSLGDSAPDSDSPLYYLVGVVIDDSAIHPDFGMRGDDEIERLDPILGFTLEVEECLLRLVDLGPDYGVTIGPPGNFTEGIAEGLISRAEVEGIRTIEEHLHQAGLGVEDVWGFSDIAADGVSVQIQILPKQDNERLLICSIQREYLRQESIEDALESSNLILDSLGIEGPPSFAELSAGAASRYLH